MSTKYLRTSERGSYKRCQWAWWQGFVTQVKPHVDGPALRFGDLIHRSLALYYKPGKKRGPKPAATFRRLYAKELKQAEAFGFRDGDGKWSDAGTLGEAMLKGYHETYHDRDLQYRVIAAEQTFKWKLGRGLPTYVGTFDGVWEDMTDGYLLFPEHKTTGKMAKDWEHLEFDDQATSYWTYGPAWMVKRQILRPEDVHMFKGILYNFLRKALPDERDRNELGQYLNQDGTVSKNQPSPLFARPPLVRRDLAYRKRAHQQILDEVREMMAKESGELPIYKNPGPLYMPNCSGCAYRGMCILHQQGHDWESYRDATMKPWDPYADHLDPHSDVIQ